MGVEFETDQLGVAQKMQMYGGGQNTSSSKFSQFLLNKGWAKSEKGAQVILLGIVVINIVITVLVIKYLL